MGKAGEQAEGKDLDKAGEKAEGKDSDDEGKDVYIAHSEVAVEDENNARLLSAWTAAYTSEDQSAGEVRCKSGVLAVGTYSRLQVQIVIFSE